MITTCFGYPFWAGAGLELFWNPFWDPELVQNLLIFGSNFGSLFLGFWISLGASWELSWASWGSLERPQEWKNADSPTRKPLFYKCSFLAFWSSWWPSWAHLGPSWADMIPKWAPKWTPKGVQKVTKKWSKKWPQKWTKNDPKKFQKFKKSKKKSLRPKVFWALFRLLWRWAQDGFKIVQDSPKTISKWSQNGSRLAQIAQDSPKNSPT